MTQFTTDKIAGNCLPIFVNNDFITSKGETFASFDPATGKEWSRIADATTEEVDAAVMAARAALKKPSWRDISQSERGALLGRLSELVSESADRLARLETRDNGKLFREMQALANAVALGLRYFAGMADKVEGTTIPVNKPDMLNFTIREPIGVIATIVPWNSPLLLLNRAWPLVWRWETRWL